VIDGFEPVSSKHRPAPIDVEEISCGLNDVANFKNLGIPVKSVIEVSRLVDPHSVPSQYSRVGGELVV
jgi:hypothetical protein